MTYFTKLTLDKAGSPKIDNCELLKKDFYGPHALPVAYLIVQRSSEGVKKLYAKSLLSRKA